MKRVKPNILQKLLHLIVSIRPINAFFSTRMHRMDFFLLKLTGGKYTFAELAGWPIIQITTTGAKSGQKRTMPLIASMDGTKIILIASSFGVSIIPAGITILKRILSVRSNIKVRR